ncbi:sugar phosphate isomerase [Cytophagales bacterium WSM2-2]|nr:sugar phosphate isomerase [Cytophagales bacterium WSM2-2]
MSALALPAFSFPAKKKIGLQLYSLRDVILKDVPGTLKQVASFGYAELESYGYSGGKLFGLPVSEVGKMVTDLGMDFVSGHFGVDQLPQWEKATSDMKSLGMNYMAIASLPGSDRSSLDNLKKICESINKSAEICKKYKIKMAFHNHADEFAMLEGKTIYDWMLQELDPKLVSMELDLYWVIYAGQDPLKLFADHPGRFEQWHVKDMNKTDRKLNADIGTGSIDFKPIFAKAKQSGMKHFYVEQETYPVSSIESIKVSAENIRTLLIK